ncbi:hypothetical protein [Miltoncostaea oceani]|uniref:hypothetical protein n=1 Tax=Miltoncostaea oceani TaxID=2843216 RepID=UPI001C3CCDB7|nr:hypothetical protein [Miltoncostaea oceani]
MPLFALIRHPRPAPAPAAAATTTTAPSAAPTVLVVWCGHRPGPWAVRSLRTAGHRVIAAHPHGDPGGRSTAVLSPRRYPPAVADPAGFLAWIRETCLLEGVDVVLPLDEDVVRLLAENPLGLTRTVVAGPDARQFRMLCDKLELANTAALAGADHPASVEVGVDGPAGPWPALPSIVKPRTSLSDAAAAPVVSVRSVEERDAAIAHLRLSDLDAVVQEQIIGRPWVLHCVRDAAGTVGMVAARVETTYPRVVGTSSVSTVVPIPPDLERHAARLLDVAGYVGPCCMNLLERDGRYWFHDINLRLAASVGASVSAGFDLPRLGVEAALGRMTLPVGARMRSITYVPLASERAALRDAMAGRTGEVPRDLALRIARAAVARDHQLDPPLHDPQWAYDRVTALARRALRALPL